MIFEQTQQNTTIRIPRYGNNKQQQRKGGNMKVNYYVPQDSEGLNKIQNDINNRKAQISRA